MGKNHSIEVIYNGEVVTREDIEKGFKEYY